ncbi:MAG: sulfurtransferase TusA family protein [Chloroflexi bacterium]|nr:sulfurtransferase TusA family protein [Chloroflexota bacterium]
MPVIQAKQAMDKLSRGQVLKVIATDPGSKADIPSWARAAGHHLLKAEQQDKKFLFWVQKGQEGAQ